MNVDTPVPPCVTVRPEMSAAVAADTRPYSSTVNDVIVLDALNEPVSV